MKLNYTVDKSVFNKDQEQDGSLKNKTKLSMQSTVSSALASKLPSAPAQVSADTGKQGWGASK